MPSAIHLSAKQSLFVGRLAFGVAPPTLSLNCSKAGTRKGTETLLPPAPHAFHLEMLEILIIHSLCIY